MYKIPFLSPPWGGKEIKDPRGGEGKEKGKEMKKEEKKGKGERKWEKKGRGKKERKRKK